MTPNVTVTFVVRLTSFMTLKGHRVIRGLRDLFHNPKVHGDIYVSFDLVWKVKWPLVTYFMTQKVSYDCDCFDLYYDPKGRRVIRSRQDLYDHKGHDELFGSMT